MTVYTVYIVQHLYWDPKTRRVTQLKRRLHFHLHRESINSGSRSAASESSGCFSRSSLEHSKRVLPWSAEQLICRCSLLWRSEGMLCSLLVHCKKCVKGQAAARPLIPHSETSERIMLLNLHTLDQSPFVEWVKAYIWELMENWSEMGAVLIFSVLFCFWACPFWMSWEGTLCLHGNVTRRVPLFRLSEREYPLP